MSCISENILYGTEAPPETFGELAAEWLAARRTRVKESTYVKYRNLLNSCLLPEMAQLAMAEVTADTLRALQRQLLSERQLAPKTVSDAFSVLRSVLRYGRETGVAAGCTGEEVAVRLSPKPLRILSAKEQKVLLEHLLSHPSRRNAGILLCLCMGLRLGEVCALRWEDVSENERTVFVSRTMQRLQRTGEGASGTEVVVTPPKSPSSVRVIPIPSCLMPVLAPLRAPEGYFLTGDDSFVEPRTMENHFKRLLGAAGLSDVRFHCLRHTFATRCVEAGFDVKTLSEILGHSCISVTMDRYVHPTLRMKRENMEKLAAFLEEAAEPPAG